jgi:alanyl-tRNA synthetase
MGFERLCMALQGKQSNYDTDVFQPIIRRIEELSGKVYGTAEETDIAMRVIADHLRAISFSIADGQLPSNVKAGYVIRRILRRAVRYGYTYLGFHEPFICRLVPVLVAEMGHQYPELVGQQELIEKVIAEEENSFLRTLATGINLLDQVIAKARTAGKSEIEGTDAFVLYDTYGFPIDLTELIASEQGMQVDHTGFQRELEAQKSRSRNAAAVETDDWVEVHPSAEGRFIGYDTLEADVQIERYRRVSGKNKTFYQLVFPQTPFYGNSGGQVGDTGFIEADGKQTKIVDTQKENGLTIHLVEALPDDVTATFRAVVDGDKRVATANNHTATHLLQEALREVLGGHVEQKGSLVSPEYLRFDFSHFQKVTDEQLRLVERIVNRKIRENLLAEENRECTMEEAQQAGAMMLFGEKYGDKVRMIRFGSSVELCGGTHAGRTGQIGLFLIRSESAISAGVRRIEAVTASVAEEMLYDYQDAIGEIKTALNSPAVLPAITKMKEENSELSRKLEAANRLRARTIRAEIEQALRVENGVYLTARRIDIHPDLFKEEAMELRQAFPTLALVIGAVVDDKPALAVALGDDLVTRGMSAATLVRTAAKAIQGGGGGQPFYATAGGKNPAGIDEALAQAQSLIREAL